MTTETAVVEKKKKIVQATEEGKVFWVPLKLIGTYNVREVLPRLAAAGRSYTDLIKMALGTDESKTEFVRLVDEHEEESRRLEPKEQTLTDLAASILDNKQIQPIMVRQTGTKAHRDTITGEKIGDELAYGYQIIVGGRRTMACAYLHALGLGLPQVSARQRVVSKDEALDISIAENLHRRNFSTVQLGQIVGEFRHRDTPMTWAEIAKKLRFCERTLKDAYALAFPDADAPADLMDQVSTGKMTKAAAVQVAKGKTKLGDGGSRLLSGPVRKAISVKALEALMDATPDDGDPVNVARFTALAEAVGSTFEAEMTLSRDRKARLAAKDAA